MSGAESDTTLFRYRFGSAEFDETRFELRVAGLAVHVERKPLEVLALLLQHAGEVVTKEELLTTVWAGRPSVEAVVTNALTKLRDALGEENAGMIVTQPRVGYRLIGTVDRVVVGRAMTSRIQLRKGEPVPLRPEFQLESLLNASNNSEVWVALHPRTRERRVYKFSSDGERLSTLKREVTLNRLLRETLGERNDMVRILDWNFETSPFFIECEFGGESLQDWAQKAQTLKQLTQSQRIELFLQIAGAVAAAHDVGVLHKDIKPANILITHRSDTTLQIRLTDFGSGKLLDPQRIQELGITQLGLTLTTAIGSEDHSGTLLYLAPELMTHQASTIQSDVYALGMVLYQLLISDLRKPLVPGWERDIDDELLRDDIRSATEGNPAHRLNSVHALIERLHTLDARSLHLQQERQALLLANKARDALKRTEARRPWVMAAGILLLVGLATSSWLYAHAIHTQHQLLQSQAQTLQQTARAEAVTSFLNNDVLGAGDPFSSAAAQNRTVKEALAYAADNMDGKFVNEPMTEAAIRMTLGEIFNGRADRTASEAQWRRAITVLNSLGSAASPSLLRSRYGLAQALVQQSKFDEAAAELKDADQLRLKSNADDTQLAILSHQIWGNYSSVQQQTDQAVSHFEQALQLLRAQTSPNLQVMDAIRWSLGYTYIGMNQLEKAEHLLGNLANEIKQRRNPSKLMLAGVYRMYGQSMLYQHKYKTAEPFIEQAYQSTLAALGASHPLTLDTLNTRCELYSMTKQLERSLKCMQESYDLTRTTRGADHWLTLSMLMGVGQAQYALNRYLLAAQSLESARTGLVKTIGTDNPMTQGANYYLARSLLQLHQADKAAVFAQQLDEKALEGLEPGAPWAMRLQLLRGMVLLQQRKHNDGIQLIQSVAQLHDDADPTDTILHEARLLLHKPTPTNNDQHLADINQ